MIIATYAVVRFKETKRRGGGRWVLWQYTRFRISAGQKRHSRR
jgi:hypothetical protein